MDPGSRGALKNGNSSLGFGAWQEFKRVKCLARLIVEGLGFGAWQEFERV